MTPTLMYKRLYEDSIAPTKGHPTDACFDLYLHSIDSDVDGYQYTCGTGIALEIPDGYMVKVYPRSSISKTFYQLANSVGIIDPDYTGEIFIKLNKVITRNGEIFPFEIGDRIAQMRMEETLPYELAEVSGAMKATARGAGGFGSTGS